MSNFDNRIKLDIFKAQSTYQNDYKKFPPQRRTDSLNCSQEFFHEKEKKPREFVPRNNETFTKLRPNVHIPFNLLWRPKEITGTNPYEPFRLPVIPESADTEEVRKTRPRIYMSPAFSMDDIDDPEVRKVLCHHMYTTEWANAIQETEVQAPKRQITDTTIERSDHVVRLKVDLIPPLPDAFRNKGKDWENGQLKSTVDPTKTFWQHKDPPVIKSGCFDPMQGLVPEKTKQEIRELISQDRLRLAHDSPIPGYTGYKPRFSYGVSLAKIDMPVVHPFLSVSQAITKRYA